MITNTIAAARDRLRIWIWHPAGGGDSSPIRVTLHRGKPLAFAGGGPTEEGASYWAETYCFDGHRVWMDRHTHDRDCDGTMSDSRVFYWATCMPTQGRWIAQGCAATDWQDVRDESLQMPIWEPCSEFFRDSEIAC